MKKSKITLASCPSKFEGQNCILESLLNVHTRLFIQRKNVNFQNLHFFAFLKKSKSITVFCNPARLLWTVRLLGTLELLFTIDFRLLDARHDKHEAIFKLSRDINTDSKRLGFAIHRAIDE